MYVGDFLNLYVFPTERRAFSQREIFERATEHGLTDIADHAKRALEHETKLMQLELERKSAGASTARFSPETVAWDGKVDKAVTGIHRYLDSQVRLYEPEDARAVAADAIIQAILPTGPGDVTSLPYEQESEVVGSLLERLRKADLAPSINALLGFREHIDQLRTRHKHYHAAVAADVARGPSVKDLDELRAQGQELLAQSVALILAFYVRTGDATTTATLLAPVQRQQQALREAHRRRRRVPAVSPETGEPVGGDAPTGDAGDTPTGDTPTGDGDGDGGAAE